MSGGRNAPAGCRCRSAATSSGAISGPAMISKVSKLLHDSIAYALSHRAEAVEYALQFGRGLDRARTDKFVGMYVNDLTLAYGERGRLGLERLMSDAYQHGLIPQRVPVEFAA